MPNHHTSTTSDEHLPHTTNTLADDQGVVRGRWRGLTMLTGTMVVDNDETKVLTTLFPVMRAALGLPLAALGTLVALSQIVGVVFGPAWALLARRANRKVLLVTLTGVSGLCTVAAGFVQNYAQLLIFYTVLCVLTAGVAPIVHELMADLFDDKTRARAAAYLYGTLHLAFAVLAPVIGLLSRIPAGWRYGFYISGAVTMVFSIVLLLFFRDPGLGASEPQLATASRQTREAHGRITWKRVRELLTIPTFALMLAQRLLAGNLILTIFAVTFLVDVYGYSTATASLVLLPYGIGFVIGSFVCGPTADRLQRRHRAARIALLQLVQVSYGVVAFFATQINWGSIAIFAGLFGVLGIVIGFNPGLNRPIVMAVVPPELRGTAFAIMLSIFQAISWAIFSIGTGYLGQVIGLEKTFLWGLVILMLVNGAFVTLLYRPYVRDSQNLAAELTRRATQPQD